MSLLDLQRDFIGYLVDEPDDISRAIAAAGKPGLDVYRNAYGAQLAACLKDSYERLWAWLGDAAFDAAARHHIAAHPPESWTLNDYGLGFGDTLADIYPDDPEVAEIAALDWALRRAFDGPDAEAFDAARLSEVDWDNAGIQFVPTLSLLPVQTNCGAIWNAIVAEEDVPPAELLPAPGWVRVWRIGLQPHFATIEAGERCAIEIVISGASFASLCDQLARESDMADTVEAAGLYLRSWLEDQMIAGFPRVAPRDRRGSQPSPVQCSDSVASASRKGQSHDPLLLPPHAQSGEDRAFP
ncbi:putative DNA-binding domain-containing protein [Sphingobium sp. AS12]|uniref:HvfC/BufC family peptide modification chaperone n=1 Tax=Sphingobium sp. AS12 TaxID=2849495 RepID=UPI001C3188F9|nr:putative DNA-binding domain-containing protein [Sphingobium sp. AS12]MBV2150093.1 putative DNA-binding domain-containing protein [Sphingobium sp. AS12]